VQWFLFFQSEFSPPVGLAGGFCFEARQEALKTDMCEGKDMDDETGTDQEERNAGSKGYFMRARNFQ
jgi:hypothetical protein